MTPITLSESLLVCSRYSLEALDTLLHWIYKLHLVTTVAYLSPLIPMSTNGMNGCKARGYGICSFCCADCSSIAAYSRSPAHNQAHFQSNPLLPTAIPLNVSSRMSKHHQRSALPSTSNIIGENLCNTQIQVTLLNHASQWKLSWDLYVMHATPLTINRSNLCGWKSNMLQAPQSHLHQFLILHIIFSSCTGPRKSRHKPTMQLSIVHYATLSNPTLYRT